MNRTTFILGICLLGAGLVSGCTKKEGTSEDAGKSSGAMTSLVTSPGTLTDVKIEQLKSGNSGGKKAEDGKTLSVHYTGWLTDGRKFDSSVDRQKPFEFKLGSHQVIPGWEKGISGMQVGEKRRLTIPPQFAYGDQGAGMIPPQSTLVFEVELLDVK